MQQTAVRTQTKTCPICHINHIKADYCNLHNCREFCTKGKTCSCSSPVETGIYVDCTKGDCTGYRCGVCGGIIIL